MNDYLIQHRITTLALLFEPFEFQGFSFSAWGYDPVRGSPGGAWLARTVMAGEDVDHAFKSFQEKFYPLVDRIGFVSQCYTLADFEPFMVERVTDNASRVAFFRYADSRTPSPLVFGNEQQATLGKLENYQAPGDAFRYLREAGAASTMYARLAMLVSALEAIAGKHIGKRGNPEINKTFIREKILKYDSLYDALYARGLGVRHRLLHGECIDFTKESVSQFVFNSDIYRAIVRYFREEHGIFLSEDVKNPMRHPLDSYKSWFHWIRPTLPSDELHLYEVHRQFRDSVDSEFARNFEMLDEMPASY